MFAIWTRAQKSCKNLIDLHHSSATASVTSMSTGSCASDFRCFEGILVTIEATGNFL